MKNHKYLIVGIISGIALFLLLSYYTSPYGTYEDYINEHSCEKDGQICSTPAQLQRYKIILLIIDQRFLYQHFSYNIPLNLILLLVPVLVGIKIDKKPKIINS